MNDVAETIESFLSTWDRTGWMHEHGSWASEEWGDARDEYNARADALDRAIKSLNARYIPCSYNPDVSRIASLVQDVTDAMAELQEAAEALHGQVTEENDYVTEGTIDPDCVADMAVPIPAMCRWNGWDCIEGWAAYRVGTALYCRWSRVAVGHRRDRDLWVLVDGRFFAEEGGES